MTYRNLRLYQFYVHYAQKGNMSGKVYVLKRADEYCLPIDVLTKDIKKEIIICHPQQGPTETALMLSEGIQAKWETQ